MALAISVGVNPSSFLAAFSFLGVIPTYSLPTAPERLPEGLSRCVEAVGFDSITPPYIDIGSLTLGVFDPIMYFPVNTHKRESGEDHGRRNIGFQGH